MQSKNPKPMRPKLAFIMLSIASVLLSSSCSNTAEKDIVTENPVDSLSATTVPFPIATTSVEIIETTRPQIVETVQATVTIEPTITTSTFITNNVVHIASLSMDLYASSPRPENVWWSEDSQTLYYQNVDTQEAWAYDVQSAISTSIPYVPRTFRETISAIRPNLPEDSVVLSISPSEGIVLFETPLPEPIYVTPNAPENSSPVYTSELWVYKDGQMTSLGKTDACFGLLNEPIWSDNENVVVVNTYGTPDVPQPCLHDAWLIDLNNLSIGPLEVPWEGVRGYTVNDLSPDGSTILLHAEINYTYNSISGIQYAFPNIDTNRALLVETTDYIGVISFDLEFKQSTSTLRDFIYFSLPENEDDYLLATVEGAITQRLLSPDHKYLALLIDNKLFGITYEGISPGISMIELPEIN